MPLTRLIALIVLAFTLPSLCRAAPGWCPARDAWADDCANPTLLVGYRHDGVTCGANNHGLVLIAPSTSGWNITVFACPHTGEIQGDIDIGGVVGAASPAVGDVTIECPGPSSRKTVVTLAADPLLRVSRVRSIRKVTGSIGQLWVAGEIGGDLGAPDGPSPSLNADAIHQGGSSFPGLIVRGSVYRDIDLLGPHAFSFVQIEGLDIRGNLLGHVSAMGGRWHAQPLH